MKHLTIGAGRSKGKHITAKRAKEKIEQIKKLTPKQRQVYRGLAEHGICGNTPHYLAIYLGYRESSYICAQLKSLVKKGLAMKIKGLRGKYTRYRVT